MKRKIAVLELSELYRIQGNGPTIVKYVVQKKSAFEPEKVIAEWTVGFDIIDNPDTPWWSFGYEKRVVGSA